MRQQRKPFFTTDIPICILLFLMICGVVFSDTISPEFGAYFYAAAFFAFLGYCVLNCFVDTHRILFDHEHGLTRMRRSR